MSYPISFVGAGPGASDLITVRGQRLLEEADFVLYAGSLITPELLESCPKGCILQDSAGLCLQEQIRLLQEAYQQNKKIVRLHSGDPSLYGAIGEQIAELKKRKIPFQIVPGVSAAFAAAAALGCELTCPEKSQSLILSRGRGRTPLPESQAPKVYAKTGASLVFYLSAGNFDGLSQELCEAGLSPDTPAAIVYRVSWPDEQILRGKLAEISKQAQEAGIHRQALLLVGEALGEQTTSSKLYDEHFSHGWRAKSPFTAIALYPFSQQSEKLAKDLAKALGKCTLFSSAKELANHWNQFDAHIFLGATGIAVRLIAPLLQGKEKDPAVLCLDEHGDFVVSLVGGHLGGANRLAQQIASATGGKAIISTATDKNAIIAFDEAAAREQARIQTSSAILATNKALLQNEPVFFCGPQSIYEQYWKTRSPHVFWKDPSETSFKREGIPCVWWDCLPDQVQSEQDLLISSKSFVLGCGCKKDLSPRLFQESVLAFLEKQEIRPTQLAALATAMRKKDEPAILDFAKQYSIPLRFFPETVLDTVEVKTPSPRVHDLIGTNSVAEAAALLASGGQRLVAPKEIVAESMTFALARLPHTKTLSSGPRIFVVGLGAGTAETMTPQAMHAIQEADVIAGYSVYLQYVRQFIQGKACIESGMRGEVERCMKALEAAKAGLTVCVVSSGDPGILAMAGLLYELKFREESFRDIQISVFPGITAASIAAARLGAPLQNGATLISLSDLLVPADEVRENLRAAAQTALALVLYNPAGKKRRSLLHEALEICRSLRGAETPSALVRHAGQEGEEIWTGPLSLLPEEKVDMSSLIFIGGKRTTLHDAVLYETRGYAEKYLK